MDLVSEYRSIRFLEDSVSAVLLLKQVKRRLVAFTNSISYEGHNAASSLSKIGVFLNIWSILSSYPNYLAPCPLEKLHSKCYDIACCEKAVCLITLYEADDNTQTDLISMIDSLEDILVSFNSLLTNYPRITSLHESREKSDSIFIESFFELIKLKISLSLQHLLLIDDETYSIRFKSLRKNVAEASCRLSDSSKSIAAAISTSMLNEQPEFESECVLMKKLSRKKISLNFADLRVAKAPEQPIPKKSHIPLKEWKCIMCGGGC
jgi:hypothetical protein